MNYSTDQQHQMGGASDNGEWAKMGIINIPVADLDCKANIKHPRLDVSFRK